MLKAEFKRMWQHKILLFTILAICIVPSLYAVSFLRGIWDPYGHLNELGMAVVNEDQPVDYNGTTLNIGQEVVDNLKKDDSFDWQFVDKDEAQQGLKDNKYYMVVTLPKDLSAKAATVTNADPEQMNIDYETNGSLNYPIETAGVTAMKTIKEQVSSKITLAYANALVSTIKSSGDQIQTAADGAKQLADGSQQLDSGVAKLQSNMPTLASGVSQLATGGNQLAGGVNTLVSSTRQSAFALNSSLPQLQTLASGSSQVASGVDTLVSTTKGSASMVKNSLGSLNTLNNGAKQVSAGAKELAAGANKVSAGVSALKQGTDKIDTAAMKKQISDDITKVAQSPQILQTEAGTKMIENLNKQIDQLGTLKDGVNQLDASVNDKDNGLVAGANKVSAGASSVAAGTQQTYNAMSKMSGQLNDKKTLAQLDTLNDGAKQVAQGNGQVYFTMARMSGQLNSNQTNNQLNQLTSGASQLNAGLTSLNNRVPTLTSGVNQLKSGTSQLTSGSSTLQNGLQNGANKIKETPLSDKTAKQIASPVKTTQHKYTSVKNYGHGLASFFLSVALFVGCLMFNYGYPVRKRSQKEGGWFSWFISKAVVGALLATVMAVVLGLAMQAVGLHVQNPGRYYGSMILYTNALMALSMFLAIAFDNPGRYITMIILILSLGAAGGTFPIATSSHFYQVANKYVPTAREIPVLRSAITGGISEETVANSYRYLTIMLIVCLGLEMATMYILMKRKGDEADKSREDGNQTLLSTDYSNWD